MSGERMNGAGCGAQLTSAMLGVAAAVAMTVSPAAAQSTISHVDSEAASILVSNPSAIARVAAPLASLKPSTPMGLAIEAALPAGESWAQVYRKKGFAPIWFDEASAGELGWEKVDALIAAAKKAEKHGLPASSYGLEKIEAQIAALRDGGSFEAAAKLELQLTKLFLRVARHYSSGALTPSSVMSSIDVQPRRTPDVVMLATASSWSARDAQTAIEGLAPQTADYKALLKLYASLKGVRDAGGWGRKVPEGATIRPGDEGKRIEALRARLQALGFLAKDAAPTLSPDGARVVFDVATEQAVRAFQERRGLAVDGVVGGSTLKSLNLSVGELLELVVVNLERARWYNFKFGPRHIVVNIPAFEVRVFDNDMVTFKSRVVVGKKRHPTPEFSDQMSHVVVNPTWHVPASIAREEMLPVLRDNPGSLAARNFTVHHVGGGGIVDPWSVDWWSLSKGYFPYMLKQGPGRGNALGTVKFIFPNKHAVYLHDTPAKSLFARAIRAFSHGCVRVHDPRGLAEVLIGAQRSDPLAYFDRLRAHGRETYVALKKKVPVYITYRTVWVDKAGVTFIRDDIYGRDAAIYRALKGKGVNA
ncbi:MAG: L,D-transpeptidase family protein [Neomegalonema sp.]|nr:L,D-transpeptidase family protein [Neomegalonema sp.]